MLQVRTHLCATRGSAAVQGVTAKSGGNQSYKVQTTAKFKVGHFREDAWGKFFNGGIAELRMKTGSKRSQRFRAPFGPQGSASYR